MMLEWRIYNWNLTKIITVIFASYLTFNCCSESLHLKLFSNCNGFSFRIGAFSKNIQNFVPGIIFPILICHNLPWGHVRSHNKISPDRFSRYYVYWIQTDILN